MMCGNCGCMRADSQCPWSRVMYTSFYMWVLYMQWVGIGFLARFWCPFSCTSNIGKSLPISVGFRRNYCPCSDLPNWRWSFPYKKIQFPENGWTREDINTLRPISLCFSISRLKSFDTCLFQVVFGSRHSFDYGNLASNNASNSKPM